MRNNFTSILTIGDEVTSGQITNLNSQWLAQELTELGFQIVNHLSCNDKIADITNSLTILKVTSSLICITGGLGPTTDDLTREAVATYVKSPLKFNQESWDRINQFFTKFNLHPKETNHQQCQFPENSVILPNHHGTADGFICYDEPTDTTLVVLPGPPQELKPMWENYVKKQLKEPVKQDLLLKWRLVGLGESILQHEINQLHPPSHLRLGYRASMPIVEIKIWIPQPDKNVNLTNKFIKDLEKCIQPWLYETEEQHQIKTFCEKFLSEQRGLVIVDHFTEGCLQKILHQEVFEKNYSFSIVSTYHNQFVSLTSSMITIDHDNSTNTALIKWGSRTLEVDLPYKDRPARFNQMAGAYLILKALNSVSI